MKSLPANWNEMNELEKDIFFSKYYKNYMREGEYDGLIEGAPKEILDAYEQFLKEKEA